MDTLITLYRLFREKFLNFRDNLIDLWMRLIGKEDFAARTRPKRKLIVFDPLRRALVRRQVERRGVEVAVEVNHRSGLDRRMRADRREC